MASDKIRGMAAVSLPSKPGGSSSKYVARRLLPVSLASAFHVRSLPSLAHVSVNAPLSASRDRRAPDQLPLLVTADRCLRVIKVSRRESTGHATRHFLRPLMTRLPSGLHRGRTAS